jgi:tRNA modification GTPase
VSAEAGTTRDALEGLWLLDEGACLLVDGPGIEAVARGPGAKAQALFEQRRGAADLVVWVVDGSVPGERESIPDTALVALAKADLPRVRSGTLGRALFALSSRTGEGLAALARGVSEALTGGGTPGATGAATLAFARHQEALRRARAALSEVGALLRGGAPLDLVAEAVRAALSALDELSGRTTPEEVLDQIFARFCLGK